MRLTALLFFSLLLNFGMAQTQTKKPAKPPVPLTKEIAGQMKDAANGVLFVAITPCSLCPLC